METPHASPEEELAQLRQSLVELKNVQEELNGKTAFFEAQANSSLDGILVVDSKNRKVFQNQRMVDLLKIPKETADELDDEAQFRWVVGMVKDPARFIKETAYFISHPDEICRDEVELKDGTIFDRYSSPVTGRNGAHYGRIWTFRDITDRKKAEAERDRLIAILESTPDMVAISDPLGNFLYLNRAGRSMLDIGAREDITQFTIARCHPKSGTDPLLTEGIQTALRVGVWSGETVLVSGTGREFPVSQVILAHKTGEGKLEFFSTIIRDATERKKLETRLFQSQKMETVGKLAGGIAHEFNSILTAIIGQSELLLADLIPGTPPARSASEISQAAGRAATLTRQLLAYGRKQILQPEILNLNEVLSSMRSTLTHLMGRNNEVRVTTAAGLHNVKVDAGQIEQVIVNIVMNAAEAMPNGGKLLLETANVMLDQEYVSNFPDLKAGSYVRLSITDTGAGMSPQVKARIFDPFFTTKNAGEGTGLGLATCHGIIKQSGGHIAVYSESGRGATFKIYLPQVNQESIAPVPVPPPLKLPRGTETILLVEDDPALRAMAATLLERLGYVVLTAADGVEALTLAHHRGSGHIDLLFTDVVMPHMSGTELAGRVRVLFPKTGILFTSAYTESAIVHQGVLNPGVQLIQKPFTPSALAHKVREVLDSQMASSLDKTVKH